MTTTTLTLADFLLARYAEDEEAARAATPGPWRLQRYVGPEPPVTYIDGEFPALGHLESVATCRSSDYEDGSGRYDRNADHIARHDPAHVLADCEAKRRVVEFHKPSTDHREGFDPYCVGCWNECGQDGAPSHPCTTARLLALPYADHPDYREEWKP